MDDNSLTHTRWDCKYHIVFAPKYRRQVIYGQIKADIGRILRLLCERTGIEIIEVDACQDQYPYAGEDTAKNQRGICGGISEREKLTDDFRQTRKSQVQIRKPALLVQRILCEHGRPESQTDRRVH